MIPRSARPATLWLGLAAIAILYLAAILRLHPANFFGVTQDDTVYFSSAQALAAGRGYILPNLPGSPPATKYPILYPWILSWVWRWNPSFPANLRDALAITVAFGLAYLVLSFLFLKRLKGIGSAEALVLVAFCAFQPTVLFYSASINSDVPFATLALAALLLAEPATERDASTSSTLCCGAVAASAILLRVLGLPIALGILAAALVGRAWKQAAIIASCAAIPVAWLASQALASAQLATPSAFASAGPGFRQTWIYYTSYIAFRKLSMLNAHIVLNMLANQFIYLFIQLPGYFLAPLFHKNIPLLFVCSVLVLWMVFAGMIREIRLHNAGWRPVHFAFLFTLGATLAWDYPEVQRFLIPFLPLLAASLWLEGKHWATQLASALRGPRPGTEKILLAASAVAFAAFTLAIAWNFLLNQDRLEQRQASLERGALLSEKREAYDWFRRNAPENSRAVAGEDGSFYLYTGRQAMAHIALRRAGAYDSAYMQEDLAHLTDVARAIRADYWVASSDDSDKQWVAAKPFLSERFRQIEGGLPELFRSSGGHVQIYSLACLQVPNGAHCSESGASRPVPSSLANSR